MEEELVEKSINILYSYDKSWTTCKAIFLYTLVIISVQKAYFHNDNILPFCFHNVSLMDSFFCDIFTQEIIHVCTVYD